MCAVWQTAGHPALHAVPENKSQADRCSEMPDSSEAGNSTKDHLCTHAIKIFTVLLQPGQKVILEMR